MTLGIVRVLGIWGMLICLSSMFISGCNSGDSSNKVGPRLSTTADSFAFDANGGSQEFTLVNSGDEELSWLSQSKSDLVILSVSDGQLAPAEVASLRVSVDWEKWTEEALSTSIDFVVNEKVVKTISIEVGAKEELSSRMWQLDHLVADAEYDYENDLIITVSSDPNSLNVLDPYTSTTDRVGLSLAPKCVAVRSDGRYAAVGHEDYVSYVDLKARKVVWEYPVSCDVFDLVLPSNGWIYIAPSRGQWDNVFCIELKSGGEIKNEGGSIYAGSRMKLHPSEGYLYIADNGISPSDIEKFDIRSGIAISMYDSPYHGDHAFSGDFWISDNGQRIFAKSGNVFRLSSLQSQDLIFNGRFSDDIGIKWLDTSGRTGYVFVMPSGNARGKPSPGVVHVYDDQYLKLKFKVELPTFHVPDGAEGKSEKGAVGGYVFSDSNGKAFHALYRAEEGSGILLDWAIVTYRIGPDSKFLKSTPNQF